MQTVGSLIKIAGTAAAKDLHHVAQRVWKDQWLDDRGPDHTRNVATSKEGGTLLKTEVTVAAEVEHHLTHSDWEHRRLHDNGPGGERETPVKERGALIKRGKQHSGIVSQRVWEKLQFDSGGSDQLQRY